MPLIARTRSEPADPVRCAAVVAVPTFDAACTIDATLASVEASIRFHRDAGSRHNVVISVVDDASSDDTTIRVRSFAEHSECLVLLAVQSVNRGRAAARNRAVAGADADVVLFLDHDDRYEPEHIHVCLDVLSRHPQADYVETRVVLADPVHPDWSRRIEASLTQNLGVRAGCHRLIGGFHEEPQVEAYGCDDVLYNRTLHALFHGVRVPRATVHFTRRPGNSLDRQYQGKFSRPVGDARPATSAAQQELADEVIAFQERRQAQVRRRLGEPTSPAARATRCSAPFDREDEPIFAMMVTDHASSRAPLAQVAVGSFAAQDYGNRILVVVAAGDPPPGLAAIPEAHRIVIRAPESVPLGELRNRGLDAIPVGALWTYWDDAAWYHPCRLSAQRKVLDVLGVSACLLTGQVTYSPSHDFADVNRNPGGFAATLLSRKHPAVRFPARARAGEDSTYLSAFQQAWSWYPWQNRPELMVRLHHAADTNGPRHVGMSERPAGTWRLSRRCEELLVRVLDLCRDQGVDLPPPRSGATASMIDPQQRREQLSSIELLLTRAMVAQGSMNVVQVGANDGRIGDPIFGFVMQHRFATRIVLVEPQMELHEQLRANYATHPTKYFSAAAISAQPTERVLYRIKPDAWHAMRAPYFQGAPAYRAPSGVTSADKNHVMQFARQFGSHEQHPDQNVEALVVRSITLGMLLEEAQLFTEVDLLQIDVEGFDDDVIYASVDDGMRPALIHFEHVHLPDAQKAAVASYLRSYGYQVLQIPGSNWVAVRHEH